jgi:hypothetical protein
MAELAANPEVCRLHRQVFFIKNSLSLKLRLSIMKGKTMQDIFLVGLSGNK